MPLFRRPKPGAPGQTGPQGERGPAGPAGRDGKNGRDGKPGVDGRDGAPGQRGERGPKGERGLRGPRGIALFPRGGGSDLYLKTDGSRGLSADWDAGSHKVKAETLESDVATGTAPVVVASTTKVSNLNADLLDGFHDTAFVKKSDTHFRVAVLDTPVAADVFPMFQFPYAVTLTKVTATAKGGTSITFNLEERSATTLGSAGTDTMTSDLVADTDGASTTSFSNAEIAANAFLVFCGSALSGTVNQVVVMIEYTIDS